MKDLNQWATVHELYRRNYPIRKIARELHISRNTVRKLLNSKEEPRYHRDKYTSLLDPFKEKIYEWRCDPYNFNGTRIFNELVKIGYQGSIGPVYRFLRHIDEDTAMISSKATVRVETPPGDQAQFDWSPYEVEIAGSYRTVYCFSLVLSASRKKAVCFSLKQDSDAIYEAIQSLYDMIGGTTAELLIDNPRSLVNENNPKSEDEIKYNPYALLMAQNLGIELNACPCYWPRKKGKIEKPFQYIEEQFIKGNRFASMEELNQRGNKFIDDWNSKIHTTTRRIPDEYFELEEKSTLGPLPDKHYYMNDPIDRIVSNDGLVSIEGNKYSVPVRYAGKKVRYRIIWGYKILIYDKNNSLIASWEKDYGKHNIQRNEDHYEDIKKKVSTSIPQIRRDFTAVFPHGALYLEEAGKKFTQPTHHARKIMELCDLYSEETLDKFIEYAIENDQMDIKSFKSLLKNHYLEIAAGIKDTEADDNSALTRECSYYEDLIEEGDNGTY